ncbi:MAG: chromosome segregation protein SMC [Lachnospiraceae bacterium]|nr:chromosome segregation protein SMC [Lachnospiraceae bacterium]
MYLKSIEMHGFKSFANKITLEFHDGITGIVGPNGSGKSNVGDAVRWVLGEQSAKQLRGGNMQDVIFSGTETRKPLGFASVAITLDNSDHQLNIEYDEVTVTRRLYRSGESEYLLNGKNCRLKDINELFYDTGIGKEGYSIIGQGQIEKILSGKPEDRRELFDEAAGIVKFKRRKAATIKKLEEEQSNLVRVTDILSELSRQVGPLEKQAEKARVYLKKRDELKELDLDLFCVDSRNIRSQRTDIEEKKSAAEEELAGICRELEETKKEYDSLEQEIQELDDRILKLRENSSGSVLRQQQMDSQIAILKEQIRAIEQTAEHYQERLEAIAQEKIRRERVRTERQNEGRMLLENFDKAGKEKRMKEMAVEDIQNRIVVLNEEANQARTGMIDLLNTRSTVKGKLQRYDTMLEQITIRKSELLSRVMSLKTEERSQLDGLQQQREAFEALSGRVREKRDRMKELQLQLENQGKTMEEASQKLEVSQREYHRQSSRLESLRNMAERYDGYGNSIKKVMEQKDRNPGIHGVVADLIQTGKKYETAVETALGGAMQNIVTDNESTAKYLIEFLKRGHFGRATFLPLTSMKEDRSFIQKNILAEPGVLGSADTLVTCQDMYRNLVKRLLGKTVVVDTIDHAIAIGRKYSHSVRMVTLEGELLSPGGSMTGGSFRNNSNLLGRKREIEDLEKQVRTLKQDMQGATETLEQVRQARGELRRTMGSLNEDLQRLYLEQNTAKINYDSAREKAGALKNDYLELQNESREIEGQISEITENREQIRRELEESQEQELLFEQTVEKAENSLEQLREKEQAALEQQENARLSFASLEQQTSFLKASVNEVNEEIRRLEKEEREIRESLDSQGSEIQEKEKEIQAVQDQILQEKHASSDLEEQLRLAAAEKEERSKIHRSFFSKRDELSEYKSRMDKECFRFTAQLEKLEERREGLINYLWNEYEITPDQVLGRELAEDTDLSSIKKAIVELKNEMKALGNVNINAIDEYKEVKERYEFLSDQYNDLVTATDTLKKIVAELEEGMRRQFEEKFQQIRVEFDKTFKILFGGGRGTLELMEGVDILEAGIRIISQPPGKKLQNMMQMSGGEKSLTAIALLFAIQNLKPSPFCLLDEIEAALDESNVDRFASYLHKLTKNTQFIIITHRRGTMATADRLYGITMQEKGVSTLVSVNLIENELDA